MPGNGWIKLHRRIRDNKTLQHKPLRRYVFEEILLQAQYTEETLKADGKEITLKPGQCLISVRSLARDLKVDEKQIRRILDLFKSVRMIRAETSAPMSALGTLVTVCNWSTYQDDDEDVSAPMSAAMSAPMSAQYKKEKNLRKDYTEADAPDQPPGYAFEGKLIRLNKPDFDRWLRAYPNIPDLMAELCAMDDWYDENLKGADRKKWFVRCSQALANRNAKHKSQARPKTNAGHRKA